MPRYILPTILRHPDGRSAVIQLSEPNHMGGFWTVPKKEFDAAVKSLAAPGTIATTEVYSERSFQVVNVHGYAVLTFYA